MSRSYKKPYVRDKSNARRGKKHAAKTVRNTEDVGSGGTYKKYFESWNISDFNFYSPSHPKWKRK